MAAERAPPSSGSSSRRRFSPETGISDAESGSSKATLIFSHGTGFRSAMKSIV
ncbi:MAG: hypothetical protein GY789_15670 [Hyphomicrobiales bacterium]|nr:hypothetical protein [Hyphomicrobiales bacterium]MCP4999845.1 hypothetical protein [Hyphomicrobiales bacterium]